MRDARPHLTQQRAQLAPRLQRVDHARGAGELAREAVAFAKLDLIGEIVRPRRRQVLGVLHRERHHLPAEVLEHAVLLEEQHLGAAARQRTFQMSDWSPSQRIVSQQFYDHVQGGATGVALVTTPVTGNSPGEYRGVVRWAQELNAKNFWISVPRPYAVNVVRQAYEIGLGPNFNYHFLDFSEWQASQLPEGATAWTAVPFVASDDHPAVRDFVARARRRSGHDLVTHVAFTHYNAIQALKVAMEKAGTTAGDKVMAALDGATLSTATGPVVMGKGRYASMPIYVARATRRTFEVVKKYDAVATGSTCA